MQYAYFPKPASPSFTTRLHNTFILRQPHLPYEHLHHRFKSVEHEFADPKSDTCGLSFSVMPAIKNCGHGVIEDAESFDVVVARESEGASEIT
jgi:hypothetical protein